MHHCTCSMCMEIYIIVNNNTEIHDYYIIKTRKLLVKSDGKISSSRPTLKITFFIEKSIKAAHIFQHIK
jgi:hypothetical protein